MKFALLSAVAIAALSGVAIAAPASAQEVEIEHAVARVIVIVEDRTDIGVEVTQGNSRLPAIKVRRVGNDVKIDGDLGRNAIRDCNSGPADARQPGEGASVQVNRQGRIDVSTAPMIVIRTPQDVQVNASGAIFGSIGRGASAIELGNAGCGAWTVANTDGDLSLAMGGSGTIRAGTSRRLDASVGGSGSIVAGATRGLEAAVGGSGDITVARVDGPGEVAIGGSGDIVIRAGTITNMDVAIAGSGNVDHAGEAGDLDVSIAGSGDVRIGRVTGNISRSVLGSGDIVIGR